MKTTTAAMNVPDMVTITTGTKRLRNMSGHVMTARGMGGKKMTNEEAIETLKANYPDACFEQLREAVDIAIEALIRSEFPNSCHDGDKDINVPNTDKYEYHYDHTDCIWYRPEARNRCPSTCAQYRDGWNDAMNYIFRDGKGYRPYRRGEQYGE